MENINLNNCLNCKEASCSSYCPSKVKMGDIIKLLKKGKEAEAIKLYSSYNIIGFITGKLCDHNKGCYGHCNNKKNPVDIPNICYNLSKSFVENLDLNKVSSYRKIAIIGGGVAGIITAYELLINDIIPVIYEKESFLGGVLTKYLPSFRYNEDILNKFTNKLINAGLIINYNKELGKNLTFDDLKDFEKCVFALGASIPINPYNIENKNILDAFIVLDKYKKGEKLFTDENVLVLGGGNTAYDVARAVNFLGNHTSVVYRRDIFNSPANISEINAAISEGVNIIPLTNPFDFVIEDNKLKAIKAHKTILFDDGSSRLSFKETTEEITIPCDKVVIAYGANCDYSYLKTHLKECFDSYGWPINNSNKYFFVGDYLTGPKTFSSANYSVKQIIDKIIEK